MLSDKRVSTSVAIVSFCYWPSFYQLWWSVCNKVVWVEEGTSFFSSETSYFLHWSILFNFVLVNNNLKMHAVHLLYFLLIILTLNTVLITWVMVSLIIWNAPTSELWLLWQTCYTLYTKYNSFWLLSLRFYSIIWFPIGFPSWDADMLREKPITSWTSLVQTGYWNKLCIGAVDHFPSLVFRKSSLYNLRHFRDLSTNQYCTSSGTAAAIFSFLGGSFTRHAWRQ